MITLRQKLTKSGAGFSKEEVGVYLRGAMQASGDEFHDTILDKHFQAKHEREYHYGARSKKYQLRKISKKHHRDPLVWSGKARRDAKAIRDIRASANQAKVVLHLPKYFYAYHKPGSKDKKGRFYATGQVDKSRELMTVSPQDTKILIGVMDKEIQERIDTAAPRPRPLGT
jgi:hypothetical protein